MRIILGYRDGTCTRRYALPPMAMADAVKFIQTLAQAKEVVLDLGFNVQLNHYEIVGDSEFSFSMVAEDLVDNVQTGSNQP
jgi:hypothetical protein